MRASGGTHCEVQIYTIKYTRFKILGGGVHTPIYAYMCMKGQDGTWGRL